MDRFDIFKGCKCLYTPKGAAREYAPVGCNFYRGCPYQCLYCYNRKGLTAGVMGVDHAVLENCFVNRPKKYVGMTSEEYALKCFVDEIDRHQDYLRDMGIFFSFSTDPLLPETWELTMDCAAIAVGCEIPVKILTKSAFFDESALVFRSLAEYIEAIPESCRKMFAFGFTLTGRDDQEPVLTKSV